MRRKTDLSDFTFLFAVKVDCIERVENLLLVINYLQNFFDTSIAVLESAKYNNGIVQSILTNIDYTFVQDFDPIFYRTKYINMLARKSGTPFTAVWDSDVLVDPKQISKSATLLRNGLADFVFPYSDCFYDTTAIIRELFIKYKNIELLKMHKDKMTLMYPPVPVGGCFIVNTEKYISAGMENTKFYGWGREDGERLVRMQILGMVCKRIKGFLYHLHHPRGFNSNFYSQSDGDKKLDELLRINSMSRSELENEISYWK